ncbi:MAG: cobalamin biosynthesis protein [Eubacteriales bacterium]
MKNIAVVSFTKNAKELNEEIARVLERYSYECISYIGERSACEAEMISVLKDTRLWVDEHWKRVDAFIFIGGADIATRMISKLVEDKMKDPAVLVMDEACRYLIPILGNHLGLGNDLAHKLGKLVNAKEIITTPQEIQEKFTIEKFAERNDMELGNREQARTISSAILEGQHIGFYCEWDIEGEIPSGLTHCQDRKELSWYTQRIAVRNEYVIGMGLKEGVPFSNVEALFLSELDDMKIDMKQVKGIATIRDRKDEPALCELSEKYRVPILSYTAKELRELHVIGGNETAAKNEANISERSAILGSEGGELVKEKVAGKGATFAAAKKVKTLYFD